VFRRIGRDGGLKDKLIAAVRRVESHKRELGNLRGRLETRKQALFDAMVRAKEKRDESRSVVYANEYAEVKNVIRVVTMSELALTQIIVRFESMCDIGDAMAHMSSAFKVVKKVSSSVEGLVPALENAVEEANSTLSGTLTELGNISPNFRLNLGGSVEDLTQDVERYAEMKAVESEGGLPASILQAKGASIVERAENLAILASEERSSKTVKSSEVKEENERLIRIWFGQRGEINILEAAASLNLPVAEVEKVALEMISEDGWKAEYRWVKEAT
jgi:division protein CdvB (Snf7/Vps24/ESCRT-III family)